LQKITAYYLFLFYAAAVCKPLSVWLADALAHGAFEHQHMTGVHHHQGKDHVHFQMNKAANDDAPEQKSTAPNTSFIESLSRIDRFVTTNHFRRNRLQVFAGFLQAPFPPPWC
jgi:hypothetical protein